MDARPVFEAEVDPAKNVARTYFRGHVTGAVLQAALGQVESLLGRMRPGFTVLADMSELELMDLDGGLHIAKIMDMCLAHKVGKVVRVIPDPVKDIGLNILSIVHYRGTVPIATYQTLAEAERELE